jgi:radical SAM superfamily enzyme YgiQ (UPF0313 family)
LKILLVYPTTLDYQQKPLKYRKAYLPALSLAIIDALTPSDHSVRVINDCVEKIDYSVSYDLVGITALTSQAERAYQIASKFRQIGVKVVIGGVHASILPQEVKRHADSVVIGEAENIWEQILYDCQNEMLKPFYQDIDFPKLDRLVIPRWTHTDLSLYRRAVGRKMPRMPIYTTRGCVHGCKFCSVTKYFGRTYRFKPVSNVLAEIDATNATSYFFVDDNIVCNPAFSEELFRALSKKKIRWFSQANTRILKAPHLIELAGEAGCTNLFIGIESFDPESLKSVNKGFNKPSEYLELFKRLERTGIRPWASLIFGFDNDTPEKFRENIDFLTRNNIWNIILWILTPLPGTDLYTEMVEHGRITEKSWSKYDLNHLVFKPYKMNKAELLFNFWDIYRELYSARNIFRRTLHMISTASNPVNELIYSLATQLYYRKKLKDSDHPYSMGLGKPQATIPKEHCYR